MIIKELIANPESRRCVLQMWEGGNPPFAEYSGNLMPRSSDLHRATSGGKDVPCNLCCMFSIRTETVDRFDQSDPMLSGRPLDKFNYLDMTVVNRSNDLIWGLLGANVVHFSYLLEHMANCIGVEVGHQTHFTNNLHAYVDSNSGWKPDKWLSVDSTHKLYGDLKTDGIGEAGPADLIHLMNVHTRLCQPLCVNNYLATTVQPALMAFNFHKERDYTNAQIHAKWIESQDWRIACRNWLDKRELNWRKKENQ